MRYIITSRTDIRNILADNNTAYLMPMTDEEIDEAIDAISALDECPGYGNDWTEFLETLNPLDSYSPTYTAR